MFKISSEKRDLFKEMYYFELERKESINSRISVPIGVITILSGAVFYFLNIIDKVPNMKLKLSVKIIFWLFLIVVISTIVLTAMAYYGYKYFYIPIPRDIEKDYKIIQDYYDENYTKYFKSKTQETKDELINKKFDEYLCQRYMDATTSNTKLNTRKLRLLRYAGWGILISLFLGLILFALLKINTQPNNSILCRLFN